MIGEGPAALDYVQRKLLRVTIDGDVKLGQIPLFASYFAFKTICDHHHVDEVRFRVGGANPHRPIRSLKQY